MKRISEFFKNSPQYFGFVIIGLGVLLITGSIRKWKWLTQGSDGKVFNDTWFSGTFGIKKLRILYIIVGVVLILIGIAWFFIYLKLKSL